MASESKSSGGGGGVSFVGLLQLLFIGLKLTGYISWSWWWVMSPTIAYLGFVGLMLVIFCFCAVMAAREAKENRRRR